MAVKGELAKRILEKANRHRSPLYLWLYTNYAEISPVMSRSRPSWTALAETAAEVDENGNAPNANSVRAAWLRVCRGLERSHVKGRSATPSLPEDDEEPPNELPIRHTFRRSKIR